MRAGLVAACRELLRAPLVTITGCCYLRRLLVMRVSFVAMPVFSSPRHCQTIFSAPPTDERPLVFWLVWLQRLGMGLTNGMGLTASWVLPMAHLLGR